MGSEGFLVGAVPSSASLLYRYNGTHFVLHSSQPFAQALSAKCIATSSGLFNSYFCSFKIRIYLPRYWTSSSYCRSSIIFLHCRNFYCESKVVSSNLMFTSPLEVFLQIPIQMRLHLFTVEVTI